MQLQQSENFIVDRSKSGRGRYQLDGKPMTGVTTICNEQAKGFLIDWAAKLAYQDSIGKTEEEIKEILKTKNYASKRTSDNAKDKGTLAHDYVERFCKNFIDKQTYLREVIEDEEVANSVYRFYDWAEKNKVEFLASEESVYSRKFWYAGSFDFICRLNDKLLLGDFKTSKQIDITYPAQCAGYVIAIEENNPEIKFDGVIIVRSILAKEGETYYKKSSTGKAKKFTNDAFEVKTSFNLEREKTYFLSLLNAYRYRLAQEVGKWYESETVDYPEDDYPIEN